jgi:hypothetical protein
MSVAVIIELTAIGAHQAGKPHQGPLQFPADPGAGGLNLLAADGLENQEPAARLGQDKMKVGR